MTYLIVALVALGLMTAVIGLMGKDSGKLPPVDGGKLPAGCSSCSGVSDKCEQVCMMEAATKAVEYYDDEELDAYKGRPGNQYTDLEAEQFRDVLYTMRPEEAAGWNRSLIMRGINVPDQVRDELIMMLSAD